MTLLSAPREPSARHRSLGFAQAGRSRQPRVFSTASLRRREFVTGAAGRPLPCRADRKNRSVGVDAAGIVTPPQFGVISRTARRRRVGRPGAYVMDVAPCATPVASQAGRRRRAYARSLNDAEAADARRRSQGSALHQRAI